MSAKLKLPAIRPERNKEGDRVLLARLAAGGRWHHSCRLAGYDPDQVVAWMDDDHVFARAIAGARMEGKEVGLQRMVDYAVRGVMTEKRKYEISELTGEEVMTERVVEVSESVKAAELIAKIDNPELFTKTVKVEDNRRELTEDQKRIGLETAIKMGLVKIEEGEKA